MGHFDPININQYINSNVMMCVQWAMSADLKSIRIKPCSQSIEAILIRYDLSSNDTQFKRLNLIYNSPFLKFQC